MSRLTRDGTAEPVSRETKFSGASGDRENIHFPCSADHEQDWQILPRLILTLAICNDHPPRRVHSTDEDAQSS